MANDHIPPEIAEAVSDGLEHCLWPYVGLVFAEPHVAGERQHIGTCTFVSTHGARFLLTAAHVWDTIENQKLDLSLRLQREPVPLRVPRESIEPTRHGPIGRAIDGPDLAFLRLPDFLADKVEVHKAFYDLDRRAASPRPLPPNPYWVFAGAPQAYDRPQGPQTEMRFMIVASSIIRTHKSQGYDYVDVVLDPDSPVGLPPNFGGVSGSGLWQVPLQFSRVANPVGLPHLSGVAYYEQRDSTGGGTRFIRCHGIRSLYDHRP
jgi:hypothetical protein